MEHLIATDERVFQRRVHGELVDSSYDLIFEVNLLRKRKAQLSVGPSPYDLRSFYGVAVCCQSVEGCVFTKFLLFWCSLLVFSLLGAQYELRETEREVRKRVVVEYEDLARQISWEVENQRQKLQDYKAHVYSDLKVLFSKISMLYVC